MKMKDELAAPMAVDPAVAHLYAFCKGGDYDAGGYKLRAV